MNKQIRIMLALIILILIALFLFITAVAPIMEGFIIDCFSILIALTIVITATIARIVFGNKEKK